LVALAADLGDLVSACGPGQSIRRPAMAARDPRPSFIESHPGAEHLVLDHPLRFGRTIDRAATAVRGLAEDGDGAGGANVDGDSVIRFWRASGERAEAQA